MSSYISCYNQDTREMKLKNTLLAFPLQFPLLFALVFGVHNLTGLSIWWCVPIAFVLDWMYYFGENIQDVENIIQELSEFGEDL